MDSLAARLPAPARSALVHSFRLAGLSAAAFFWWWFAYDAYAHDIFVTGRLHRRRRRRRGLRSGGRHVGVARARGEEGHDLWLRALGRGARDPRGRASPSRRRSARPLARRLSSPPRSGACAVLRADALRQGRRPGRADAAHLAGLGHRSRHQGRELGPDRRLAGAVRPRAAVRSDQPAERRLQSAARGAPRRMGGARRPEHRRRAGRSRRRAREAKPLGEDEPLAARRRDPACALRRARTKPSPASPISFRTPSGRSRRRCAR